MSAPTQAYQKPRPSQVQRGEASDPSRALAAGSRAGAPAAAGPPTSKRPADSDLRRLQRQVGTWIDRSAKWMGDFFSLPDRVHATVTMLTELEASLSGDAGGAGITPDSGRYLDVLREAKALVFLTDRRVGLIMGVAHVGAGFIVSRLPGGNGGSWSPPSAISTGGLGPLLGLGVQSSDVIIALFSSSAIAAFEGAGQLRLGASASLVAGPLGRSASVDARMGTKGFGGTAHYAWSQGLFVGVSLEGSLLLERADENARIYGRPVSVREILSGAAHPLPSLLPQADELRERLEALFPPDPPTLNPPSAATPTRELTSTTDGLEPTWSFPKWSARDPGWPSEE